MRRLHATLLLTLLAAGVRGQEPAAPAAPVADGLEPLAIQVLDEAGAPGRVYRYRGRVFSPAEAASLDRLGRVSGFEPLAALMTEFQRRAGAGEMTKLAELYAAGDRERMAPRLESAGYREFLQESVRTTIAIEPRVFVTGSNFVALLSVHRFRGRDTPEVMPAFFRGWPDKPRFAAVQGLDAEEWQGLVAVLARGDWRSFVATGSSLPAPAAEKPVVAKKRPAARPKPVPRALPVEPEPPPPAESNEARPTPGPARLGQ